MQEKMTKRERAEEKRILSDIITGKISIVFFALFAAVLLLIRMNGRLPDLWLATKARLWVCLGLGVLTAVSFVWYVRSSRRGVDHRRRVVSAPLALGMSATLLSVVLLYPALGALLAIVYLFAAALLFFVYEIYPFDFFLFSVATEFGAVMIPLIGNPALGSKTTLADVVILLATAALGALTTWLAYALQNKGSLRFGKVRIRKPQGMAAFPVLVGATVALLGVLGTVLFGYALYFAFAVCAVYLLVAIIYTVKLM